MARDKYFCIVAHDEQHLEALQERCISYVNVGNDVSTALQIASGSIEKRNDVMYCISGKSKNFDGLADNWDRIFRDMHCACTVRSGMLIRTVGDKYDIPLVAASCNGARDLEIADVNKQKSMIAANQKAIRAMMLNDYMMQ